MDRVPSPREGHNCHSKGIQTMDLYGPLEVQSFIYSATTAPH